MSEDFWQGRKEFYYLHQKRRWWYCRGYDHTQEREPVEGFYLCAECIVERCHCVSASRKQVQFSTRHNSLLGTIEDLIKSYTGWPWTLDDPYNWRSNLHTENGIMQQLRPQMEWINSVRYYLPIGQILKLLPKPRPRCPQCNSPPSVWENFPGVLSELTDRQWTDRAQLTKLFAEHEKGRDCFKTWILNKERERLRKWAEDQRQERIRREKMLWRKQASKTLRALRAFQRNPSEKNRRAYELLNKELKRAQTFRIS